MIKLYFLQKVMQVVTNVSKWVASRIDRKENKQETTYEDNNGTQASLEQEHKQSVTVKAVSKAKGMKHWIKFIKEDNIIYLPSNPSRNQRQILCNNRDNVVYIDFDRLSYSHLKVHYNKEVHLVNAHTRAPTSSSDAYLL